MDQPCAANTMRVESKLENRQLVTCAVMKENIEELSNWLDMMEISLDGMGDIPSETISILDYIKQLEILIEKLLPKHVDIQKLNSAVDKVMKDNATEEAAIVKDAVGKLFGRWNALNQNFATRVVRLTETLINQRNFNAVIDILLLWLKSVNDKLDTCENSEFVDQKMGQLQMILTKLQHYEQAIVLMHRATLDVGEESNFQAMRKSVDDLKSKILVRIEELNNLLTEREQQLTEPMNEKKIQDEILGVCMKKFEVNLSAKFLVCTSNPRSDEFKTIVDKWNQLLKVLSRCVMLCTEESEEIKKACWSLIEFDLPEYPLQRKTNSIPNMILEIDHMVKSFKQCDNIPEKEVIITWFEILYVLQINENSEMQSLDQIEEIIRSVTSTESIEDYNSETKNLYRALKYVKRNVQMEVEKKNHGLLDVECFISKTHKLILQKFPEKHGGIFSTKYRYGRVDENTIHAYPKYDKVESVRHVVQMIVDRYNVLHELIKKLYSDDSKNATNKLFKLSGMLLFKILEYHPFEDGNGRLARLLSSYALSLITPFPTPMYGLFSPSTREEYAHALIEARKNNGIPSTSTALIIESSYYAWKKFTEVVEMAKAGENWKLLLVSYARKAKK